MIFGDIMDYYDILEILWMIMIFWRISYIKYIL
jgi:hypothetical protein